MRKHLQNFDADRDRSDPKRAAQLFNLLWPSRVQVACANRLANSIHAANDEAAASWEVSMFDWGIRLNVGQVASLDFASDEIVAVVMSHRSAPVYSAVPVGSDVLRFAPEKIATVSPRQWDSHDQFIRAAASAKKKSPFKASFSEGVMKHVESILGRKLPRPSYQVRSLHILQGGIDNGDKAWLEKQQSKT
jgi:5-methylcytosine-specific restriction enzyme A